MRLLIANHHLTLVGGAETYLAALMPALINEGYELGFAHEAAPGANDILIPLPAGTILFPESAERIADWRPDLVYLHAMHDLDFQERLMRLAPSVAFAHGYYGLCISGMKMWKRAPGRPCAKNFDWKCLLLFHTHSCGGMNPIRMVQDFFKERRKLELLRRCDAVLTHGGKMREEYLAHGLAPDKVQALPHFVPSVSAANVQWKAANEIRLVYVGRFDEIKGGQVLLQALPEIAIESGRAVTLEMIGSGPSAAEWKAIANRTSIERVQIHFHGWLESARKDAIVAASDLLVVPSIWPEPFGQVGLEAAGLGTPAVAFDVGGVRNWLRNGVNGLLAPSDPPTSKGLAATILKALRNPSDYARMRADAGQVAKDFTVERHVRALVEVFDRVLKKSG